MKVLIIEDSQDFAKPLKNFFSLDGHTNDHACTLSEAREFTDVSHYDMILLDELNICLRYDYLNIDEVVETLNGRREMLHMIVTGRNAKDALIEAADLVTEMGQIKHPFREQNVKAQRGVEF